MMGTPKHDEREQMNRRAARQAEKPPRPACLAAHLPICLPAHLPTCLSAHLPALCLGVLVVVCLAGAARAQTDVIGMHDLSPGGTSPIKGTLSGSCLYCHAPHSGLNGTQGVVQTPLWDHKLSSVQAYTLYSGATSNQTIGALTLGSNSTLCLSCHDGTVAGSAGALIPYGNVPMSGNWNAGDVLTTDLSTMHPINFKLPLQCPNNDCDSIGLVQSLTATPPSTADTTGKVRLIGGNVECGSCHNPHAQNTDPNGYFLVISNTSGALCLACHTADPSATGMGLTSPSAASQSALRVTGTPLAGRPGVSKPNPLAGWSTSIHATASNQVPRQITLEATTTTSKGNVAGKAQATLGSYGTVARNSCSSCHATHNAQGANSLLRAADDQACIVCHNGSSNTSPPTANILAETVAPKYGHPISPGNSGHLPQEAALLNQNRHVTCVDCHNAHAANRVTTFPAAPAIRPSQTQVLGISATDGKTVINPASNQYENCLRCHGASTGKLAKAIYGYLPVWAVAASDPLNVIPQFSTFATSSHPVFHDRNSPLPQPSLRPMMLSLDGITPRRSMGVRILCTDCHNSDDNREFGGSGPNGPHGSIFPHIFERRYEFSQAGAPGTAVTNLFPNPSLSAQGGPAGGPYALCAKCHDLTKIMNSSSFSEHARHVQQDGFSCSVCHTAHGMGAQSGTISGQRLVNFDVKVVAPNGAAPISYNRATNSCSLVCHHHPHQLRTAAGVARAFGRR
jgi:predicted CXXCH cytochrome family protein